MILLSHRFYGFLNEEAENINDGVFSSVKKAKEAAIKDCGGVIDKEEEGYFRIQCGSGYTYDYDWIEVKLNKMIGQ